MDRTLSPRRDTVNRDRRPRPKRRKPCTPWRRTARNGIYDPDPVISTDGQEPLERSVITGHHWWTPSELREATEQILPLGLPGLLASPLREGIPDQPLRLH